MGSSEDLAAIIEPVARLLLGEPNDKLSSACELRWGNRGSLSVQIEKGTWYDHATVTGGGTLDLIGRETGRQGGKRWEWLEENGFAIERETEGKPNGAAGGPKRGRIIATYPYVDEAGALLFEVVRLEPKDFRQRRPDGKGGWVWSTKGIRQVIYRLPDIIEQLAQNHLIFIAEGERDCDSLWLLGIPATCNAGGAGKWRAELSEQLAGADVVIIPDNDPQKKHPKTSKLMFHADGRPIMPGQDHAHAVAASLAETAGRVRYLDLAEHWPEMPPKGDVSDWLAKGGGSAEALYALAEQAPDWSPELQYDNAEPAPSPMHLYSEEEFLRGFIPPNYLIDGLMQRRFVYALTGKTGHAKSAIALLLAELVGSPDHDAALGHRKVAKGQVLYFVGENPDDIRMRLIGTASLRANDHPGNRIFFIPGVFNIGEMFQALAAEMEKYGAFDLIIVDTSAAYFLGDEEMSNTQMGAHARTLRKLTELPGGPAVLVLCHPIKHAAEPNQLLPRGGGAFLAEMDGNFTAWKSDDVLVEMHHTGKYRGPDFEPLKFKLEPIKTTNLHDAQGRLIPTVRAVVISESDSEEQSDKMRRDEDLVITLMLREPEFSLVEIANALGWLLPNGEPAKVKVQRKLVRLEKFKLVRMDRNRWFLTEKGKDAARKISLRGLNDGETIARGNVEFH